jgi:hypothetical protein
VVVALATLQRLVIVPGVAARAEAESGEARHHCAQRQESLDPSGILLYSPECVEGGFSEVGRLRRVGTLLVAGS